MLGNLVSALGDFGDSQAILLLVIATTVGVFKGAIPGVGLTTVLSIALALVYHLDVYAAIALMLGAHAGSYFAASVSAILLNTPGAHEAYPVSLDGFAMSRKGRGGEALGLSAAATCLGGIVGCLALTFLIPLSEKLPLLFHPPEYVALVVLAVILTGSLGTDSVLKALISAGFGLMLSTVGGDPVTGEYRYTFNNPVLYGGISIVSLAIGLYALPQLVYMFGRNKSVTEEVKLPPYLRMVREQVIPGVADALRHWVLIVQSAIVGFVCGVIPGIGGFTANFLSLGIAQQTGRERRKRRREFGTGIPEGILAPEASSLAKEAGAIIPAIGLGVPSGTGMVIFLAALAIEGLQPGPGFLKQNPDLGYFMMWCLLFGGVLGTALGLVATPLLVKITGVRGPLLLPVVAGVAVVGAYIAEGTMVDVVEMVIFAFVGFALRRLNFSMAALGVGLVLGTQLEDQVYLTDQIFGWSFLKRPLADALLLIALAIVVFQVVAAIRKSGGFGTGISGFDVDDVKRQHLVLDFAVMLALTVVAVIYVVMGLHFSAIAKITPLSAGSVVALCSFLRLIAVSRRLYVLLRARWVVSTEVGDGAVKGAPHAGDTGGAPADVAVPATDELMPLVPVTLPVLEPAGGRTGVAPARPLRAYAPKRALRQFAWIDAHRATMTRTGKPRAAARESVALLWIVAMLLGCYLCGFTIGVPIVVFVYGLTATGMATARARILYSVFAAAGVAVLIWWTMYALSLSYTGVLFTS
jgi:putative tricarboxylic transport membrane protein